MDDVVDFITCALEASILLSPRDPGLSKDEILEAGGRVGMKPGELADGIVRVHPVYQWGDPRIRLARGGATRLSADFNFVQEPDYRDVDAFEFVRRELKELAAEVGESRAALPRDGLVERGVAKGLKRSDLEVAITVSVLDGILEEKDGFVRHGKGRLSWILPSEQLASRSETDPFRRERKWMERAYVIVADVIGRRSDGRHAAANPMDAFEEELAALDNERFRAWWVQHRNELRLLNPMLQPVAATVLSAALGEAALSFVVPRAQSMGLMKNIDVTKPASWRFAALIKGSKTGDPSVRAILDERTAQRCLELNDTRQRIHAGSLIQAVPSGPIPDLRPEQARDAAQTVDNLVRKIIEWLRA